MKYDWIEKTPSHYSDPLPAGKETAPPICEKGRSLHRIFIRGPNGDHFVQTLTAKKKTVENDTYFRRFFGGDF